MPRASVVIAACLLAVVSSVGSPAGAVGSDLAQKAQKALNHLGCQAGPADGDLGPHSRAGIVRFQAANDLAQSGKLTHRTRKRLFAETQVACDDRPVVRSGTGRRIVISQRQNYVWLVRSSGKVVAEGGMIDNTRVLDKGSYRVGSQCGRAPKIRRNSDASGSLWLPYFTRFAPCGVGFHRIPLHKATGGQIHPDWMLGTNLKESHGCIRLSRPLAARVWDFGRVGTHVVVR